MLDKIRWVLEHASTPIVVKANPKTWKDAVKNLWQFSEEGRASPKIFNDATPFPPFPVTRCYGWLRIDSEKLPQSFHWHCKWNRPRGYLEVGVHYAMVYEYVPDTGEPDPKVIQPQLDAFLSRWLRPGRPEVR